MPVPDCFYTAVHQRILNEMILPCRKGDDWYGVLALDNRTLPLVNAGECSCVHRPDTVARARLTRLPPAFIVTCA